MAHHPSVFPLVLKNDQFAAPVASTYYVLAADGIYLHRETALYSATVPMRGGSGLHPHKAHLELNLPRLPASLLERAVSFFRAVYERWRGEAILILFYAPPADGHGWRFALGAPPQVIRGRFEAGRFRADLRLEYGTCPRPAPEFLKLGTFHSHADVAPGHSTIDCDDEMHETGLHLTAGWVNTDRPGFVASFVVGGTRFALRPGELLPPFRALRRVPSAWLEQVTVVCESPGEADKGWLAPARAESQRHRVEDGRGNGRTAR